MSPPGAFARGGAERTTPLHSGRHGAARPERPGSRILVETRTTSDPRTWEGFRDDIGDDSRHPGSTVPRRAPPDRPDRERTPPDRRVLADGELSVRRADLP